MRLEKFYWLSRVGGIFDQLRLLLFFSLFHIPLSVLETKMFATWSDHFLWQLLCLSWAGPRQGRRKVGVRMVDGGLGEGRIGWEFIHVV